MAKEKYITKTFQVWVAEIEGIEGEKEFVGNTEGEVRQLCELLGLTITSLKHTEKRYGIPESIFLKNAEII